MPKITEQQYRDSLEIFSQLYDPQNPQLTDHILPFQRAYEKQQADLGISLFPSEEQQKQKSLKTSIEKFDRYFGPNGMIEAEKDFNFIPDLGEEGKKSDIVGRYIDELSQTKERNQFITQELNISADKDNSDNVFEATKQHFNKLKRVNEARKLASNYAFDRASDGADVATISVDIDKELDRELIPIEERSIIKQQAAQAASQVFDIIKPQKKKLDSIVDAINRKMNGLEIEQDVKLVDQFVDDVKEMPTWKRQITFAYLNKQASKIGEKAASLKGFWQNFGESAGRLVKDMYKDRSSYEIALNEIDATGEIYTELPEITNAEQAFAFVQEQTNAKQALTPATGADPYGLSVMKSITDVLPKAQKRILTPTESELVYDAILKAKKAVSTDREISDLERNIDPLTEFKWDDISTYLPTMGKASGSSAVVMGGLFATRGAALPAIIEGYKNTNYERYISKGYEPRQALAAATTTAAFEGALDMFQVSYVTRLAKLGSVVKGASVADLAMKRFALRTLETGAVETGVELVQEASPAIVGEVFSVFSDQFPEVELTQEIKEVITMAPEIGVGMIPLMLIGGGFATSADLKNARAVLSNANAMKALGIQEEDIVSITNEAETDTKKAEQLYKEAWSRRDTVLSKEVAESIKGDQQDIRRVMTVARDLGIVPTFRKVGNKYVVEKTDGTYNEFSNPTDLYLSLQQQVVDGLSSRINAFSNIENSIKEQDDLTNSFETLKAKVETFRQQASDELSLLESNDIQTIKDTLELSDDLSDQEVKSAAINRKLILQDQLSKIPSDEKLELDYNKKMVALENERKISNSNKPASYADLLNILEVYGNAIGLSTKQIQNIEENVFSPSDAEDLKSSTTSTQYLMKLSPNIEKYFGKTFQQVKEDLNKIRKNEPFFNSQESDSYVYFLNSLKSKIDFSDYYKKKKIDNPRLYSKRIKTQGDYDFVVSSIQKTYGATPFALNELEFLETQTLDDAQISSEQKQVLEKNILETIREVDPNAQVSIVVPKVKGSRQTQTLKELADISKKIFGVNVVFYRVIGNGADSVASALHNTSTNSIYINIEANIAPLDYLYGHEFGHFVQNKFPELWTKIRDEILNNIATPEEYNAYAAKLKSIYNTVNKKQAEFVSDYFGNRLTDIDFLNRLKKSNEELFNEFVDTLINYRNEVKTNASEVIADRDMKKMIAAKLDESDQFLIDSLKTLKIDKTFNYTETPSPIIITQENVLDIMNELKRIASSVNPTFEDLAFIDAITNKTTDISKPITSKDIIEKAISGINLLNSANKQTFINNVENGMAFLITETLHLTSPTVKNIIEYIQDAAKTTGDTELNKIYNKIYPKTGTPEGDFKENLMKYSIYKILSNYKTKSIEELNDIAEKLNELTISLTNGKLTTLLDEIVNDTSIALNSIQTDKVAQDLTDKNLQKEKMKVNGFIHYTDTVLAFESLLSKIFPAKQQEGRTLIKPIQDIVDDIQNGFLNVSDSVNETEQDLFNIFDNVYGFDSLQTEAGKLVDIPLNPFSKARQASVGRRVALFNFVDNTSKDAIKIKIDGKSRKLSQSFAGYILNIADQNNPLYNEQLNNKGFTTDVINEIRQKIDPKTEQIRKDVRDRILKEYSKMAKVFKDVFGFSPPKPDKFFFPVIAKNKGLSVQDKFEVTYSSGKMRSGFETISDFSDVELDLDINDQSNHLISVFNSHMYESAYQRNMFKPINKMKAILTDTNVRNAIETAYGTNTYELLIGNIIAFENNGIRSSAISQQISQGVRNAMSSVARGAMGFKLSTFFINFMSSLNTFMDNSLPIWDIIRGYVSAMFNTTGGIIGVSDKYGKTLNNPIMRRRLYQGSNTLVQLSQTSDLSKRPNWLKDFARASLQPMSKADAYAGSVASMAAYTAHYNVALRRLTKQGLSGEKLKETAAKEAEIGMVRTINKTAQPTIISGKSTWELDSHPIIKLMLMFMSETRKTLGLELMEIKGAKRQLAEGKYLSSAMSIARTISVYHILLGTMTYAMRGVVQDFMRPEDEDDQIWNSNLWIMYMMLGPLSGFPMLGSVGDSFARSMVNALVELEVLEDDKLPVYGASPSAVLSTLDAPKNAFNKFYKLDESDTPEQDLTEIIGDGFLFLTTIFNLLGIKGGETISGVSTISNVVEQSIKAMDAQED